jgi:hypothetical protein
MRDIRTARAGPPVRHSNQTPHMQMMRYQKSQVRAHGPQHQRNLSLIRQYEADPYPKSKPLGHGIAGKIGMEALDLTTGIPSLLHQIHSMRAHRGNLEAEVQPGNVMPLIGGMPVGPGRPLEALKEAENVARAKHHWRDRPELGTNWDLVKAAAISPKILLPSATILGSAAVDRIRTGKWHHTPPSKLDPEQHYLDKQASTRGAYNEDVEYLLRTKQIQPSQAAQAHRWAMTAGPGELRARRGFIRQKYKVPARYRYSGQYLSGWSGPATP